MPKRALGYLPWIPSVAVLAWAICYYLGQRHCDTYLDGFMGNLLATVLGLIAGVPVALAISGWQQREQAREVEERQHRAETQRRAEVLRLIKDELQENLRCLEHREWALDPKGHPTEGLIASLAWYKDETWRALSDGGDVGCIRDLELLGTITKAYHWLGVGKHTDQTLWSLYFGPTAVAKEEAKEDLAKALLLLLAACDGTIKEQIGLTLQAVDRALGHLAQCPAE